MPGRSARRSWTTLRSVARHRLELDLLAGLERALGGAVGLALDRLAAALAVAGGVDRDALAVAAAAEGDPVAEQLDRVDRLPAAADQHARGPRPRCAPRSRPRARRRRPRRQVERVDDLVEHGLDPLDRVLGEKLLAHAPSLICASSLSRRGRGRCGRFFAFGLLGRRRLRHRHDPLHDHLLAEAPEVGGDPVERRGRPAGCRSPARTAAAARGRCSAGGRSSSAWSPSCRGT